MSGKAFAKALLLFLSLWQANNVQAQFTVSGQIRTRTEFRDGQGSPAVRDTVPAFFTSQRTRLNFGYTSHRFKVYASVQDVRVWGQDASTVNRTTTDVFDGFMLHEAWGEISLVDTGKVIKNFTLKIGRQELVYDDVRLFGNLDWLQQARRHDAAILKFDHNGWITHLGAAFNQNAERKSNHIYNGAPTGYPASTNGMSAMYKSMQFIYVARKLQFGNVSFLAFKDDFSKFHFAEADVEKKEPLYERGVWSRITLGGHMVGTVFEKLGITTSAFYQGGKYREGSSLDEYLLSVSAMYSPVRKFSFGAGIDVTSGNNGADPSRRFQRFDPLYGTPHKFWGYMDYFYVADGFGSNGLINYYLKTKFKPKNNLTLSLDAHRFVLPAAVTNEAGEKLARSLGTEIDLTVNYAITSSINIDAGYSSMFSSSTLTSPKVKNVRNADTFSSWAYLMISIKPEFIFK
jgi:hypothetical protein